MSTQPTDEELSLIRNYLIYPFMLSVVQKNLDDISIFNSSLKPLYIKTTEIIMDLITKDISKTKAALKKVNIKVFDRDESQFPLYAYDYMVRGYKYTFTMRRELIKSEISIMLPEYINKVLKSMIENNKG